MKTKNKFYWNEDTIEYFVDYYKVDPRFGALSKSILQFVITDCDTTENTVQELFNDLITQVGTKIKY